MTTKKRQWRAIGWAVVAWLAATAAWAGFRVAHPSDEVREVAMMSVQSAQGIEESVETTSADKPFIVDFAALGVRDASKAYLMIVNEENGNAVALAAESADDTEVQLTPLVLAELEMQELGAGSSYRCMAMQSVDGARDEVVSSCRLASSLGTVEFPNFNYRAPDGSIKKTAVADRRLVATMESAPQLTVRDPGDASQQALQKAFGKACRYMSLAYELPDGRTAVYADSAAAKAKAGFRKPDASRMLAMQSRGTAAPAFETAPQNLPFALDLGIVDDSVSLDVVKGPTMQGLQIWSDALCGEVPVSISIMMFSFSDIIPLLYDDVGDTDWSRVIGCSWDPPAWALGGFAFVESLYEQLVGYDPSDSYDIDLWMNTDMPFYYGTDGKCSSSQVDYTTIVLHEVDHGLGFMSSILSGGTCKYYDDEYWYPMIFDYYLTWNGTSLCEMTTSDRYKAIRSGELYFCGPNAMAANGGKPIKMYAPATWEEGSSVSHWDWNVTFPTFMKHMYAGPLHVIGPRKLGLLQDIGWTIATEQPTPPDAPQGVEATQGTLVDEVRVGWKPSSGAETYDVERAKGSGAFAPVATGLQDCSYADNDVEAETEYRYRVAAVNAAGKSAFGDEATGWAKAATVLSSLRIEGPATLEAGAGADYTCLAVYSDNSTKDVSVDPGCTWTTPYGGAYATQEGRRLTAGKLTEEHQTTIQAEYGGKTAQKAVKILPQKVTVSFDAGACGTAEFVSREYTVGAKYSPLPKVTGVASGKGFSGWFTASSGGNQVTEDTTVAGSVTKLFARYVDTVESVRIEAPDTVEWGQKCALKCYATIGGKEQLPKTTVHWEGAKHGSIQVYADNNVLYVEAQDGDTGSVTLTATVEGVTSPEKTIRAVAPTATLELDPNGGQVSPATLTVTRGSPIDGLPTPMWDADHEFKGWYTAKSSGKTVSDGMVYDGTYTKLFARWEVVVRLESVEILGPASLASGARTEFTCTAHYSNGESQNDVAATWDASEGTMADGSYTAPGVTAEKTVTITASYTSQGVTKTAEKNVKVTPKTVNVSFDAAGGKASFASKTYTVGLPYAELPEAIWDELHGFDGWFTAAGIDGQRVTPETPVREEVTTLVAKWHDIVVLKELEVSGPASVLPGEAVLAQMKCVAVYTDGAREDVTGGANWTVVQGGSFVDADGKANPVAENTIVTVKAEYGGLSKTHNVTILPKKVAVVFDAHGGTAEFATREYVVGGTYRPLPKAEKSYNQFLGWFSDATGGRRVLETDPVEEGVETLHAQWEENPAELVKIELFASPATVVAGGTATLTCTATWSKGGSTTESVLGAAEVEWIVSPASAGAVKDGVFSASRVTEETVCTVSAEYQSKTADAKIAVTPERVAVAFDANGGTVEEASRTYVVGLSYESFPKAVGPNVGSQFDGWFTAKVGGARVTESSTCEKNVVTLFAHWTEERRLTGLRIEGPDTVTATVPAKFTCTGLWSDGSEVGVSPGSWSVEPDSAGSIDGGEFTAALVPAAATATLKASLDGVDGSLDVTVEPLTVSVRFNPCDGAVNPERKSFVVGSPYGDLPTPTRARHDFDAWYTGESKSGLRVTAETVADAAVTTLYAGWTPTPTTLTGIRIVGPGSVRSGGSAVYSCEAVYANGTAGSVVPQWSLVEGLDYGSLTLGGFFQAVETDVSRKVVVQATYTVKGVRYEDRLSVTVTPATLVVDPEAVSVEAGAQTFELLVDTYADWAIESDAAWLAPATASGSGIASVKVAVEANTDVAERVGTLTVSGDGLTATCVVKQYSMVPDEYVTVTLDPAIPGREASQRQYIKGRTFGYLPQPVREGFAFGGWWTGEGGTGTRVHALSVVGDDTTVLHGHWTDMSVAYALNNALDWVEDASHPWTFDYVDAMDRKVSMTTPILVNKEAATLTALVEGPGTIGFWWKTSSEEFFDALSFSIDGKFVVSVSGETVWQAMSRAISGYGQHVLTWTYAKDGQGAAGQDAAWLDMVSWQPDYAGVGGSSVQSADGRAVPESWFNAYGLDTGADSLDVDADGDGMSNFEEYVSGTDPTDPDSVLQVVLEFDADGKPVVQALGGFGTVLEGKTNLEDPEEPWGPADFSVHRFFRARAGEP